MENPLIVLFFIVLACLWLYSFVSIIGANIRRIYKLLFLAVIFFFPIAGFIYPFKNLLPGFFRNYFSTLGKFSKESGKAAKKSAEWLTEKPKD